MIKKYETLKLRPYMCPAGVPTIGWGCTTYEDGRPVSMNDEEISMEYATKLFNCHLEKFEMAVSDLVKIPLNPNQFSALVSFAFNVGITAFAKSTLLKVLNRRAFKSVGIQMDLWIKYNGRKSRGLIKRRLAEKELFYKEDKNERTV